MRQLAREGEPEVGQIVGPLLKPAIKAIVDARNDVTHWSADREEPRGLHLVALRMVADALFDVVLFKRVEVTDDVVRCHRPSHLQYWLTRGLAE